jgi:hypothetical protein
MFQAVQALATIVGGTKNLVEGATKGDRDPLAALTGAFTTSTAVATLGAAVDYGPLTLPKGDFRAIFLDLNT